MMPSWLGQALYITGPFVKGIQRWQGIALTKVQQWVALVFFVLFAWTNKWVAGDLVN